MLVRPSRSQRPPLSTASPVSTPTLLSKVFSKPRARPGLNARSVSQNAMAMMRKLKRSDGGLGQLAQQDYPANMHGRERCRQCRDGQSRLQRSVAMRPAKPTARRGNDRSAIRAMALVASQTKGSQRRCRRLIDPSPRRWERAATLPSGSLCTCSQEKSQNKHWTEKCEAVFGQIRCQKQIVRPNFSPGFI